MLFSNVKEVDRTYLRYLSSCLREEFNLDGIPIRIFVRTGDNPYTVGLSSVRNDKSHSKSGKQKK